MSAVYAGSSSGFVMQRCCLRNTTRPGANNNDASGLGLGYGAAKNTSLATYYQAYFFLYFPREILSFLYFIAPSYS